MMKTAARVDANQPEIVSKLRQIGAYVLITSQLKNCCDIFVAYRGKWVAMEIKDGDKPKSAIELTRGEKKFFDQAGHRAPCYVVYSVEEAIKIITSQKTYIFSIKNS